MREEKIADRLSGALSFCKSTMHLKIDFIIMLPESQLAARSLLIFAALYDFSTFFSFNRKSFLPRTVHDGSKKEKIYHHFGADRMLLSYQRSSTHQQASALNTLKHLNLPALLFIADDIGFTIFIDKLQSDFAVSTVEFAFIVFKDVGF